ncbi:SpoIID/LytB domain-containing protein [Marinicella meishanensis]|uniref:SpoIID/LytB domain-containing protein n=1 Tax=Marinicella meishanensis TaxID=2873263 RepID=UPI001CBB3C17|nr:SpoIID/LytB domain-containing protein [Marinicella sp. NBU2979]
MNTGKLIAFILLLLGQSAWSQGQRFTVRDSQTGAALEADIVVQSINPAALTHQQWQGIKLGQQLPSRVPVIQQHNLQPAGYFFQLPPNQHLQVLRVTAAGYQPLQTWVEAHSPIPITQIMLDPANQGPKTAWTTGTAGTTGATKACDQAIICGHLYDQATALPLADVAVTISGDQFQSQVFTDHLGLFAVAEPLPKSVDLSFEHSGFQSQRWTAVDTHSPLSLVIDMQPGSGLKTISLSHPLSGLNNQPIDPAWLQAKQQHEPSIGGVASPRERSTGAVFLTPPTSIRVGFDGSGGSCCGGNCTTSQVYSLETYVQRGLDNEWISSWDADSLKAGTIPYRSYGAWHVLNQVYTGYDICAGPCCQAFEFTGYTNPINAALATNGIMLDLNGELARSEYSAQNNSWDDPNDGLNCSNTDLSCGDGAVGSPATGWTCLADPLSTGLGCFGHGRGMSQWGTQFQALDGATFADIVDFYYNANNNPSGQRSQYASTPVRLDAIATDVPVIAVQDQFTIDYEVFNASDANHPFGPLLLGASLYDGMSYYSDPANDLAFAINQAGTSVLQRSFQLDPIVTPGNFDLVTALYLDVDDNGQISAIDWLLQTTTEPAALQVLAANDLIFRDSF